MQLNLLLENIYALSLEDKQEIRSILEHHIAELRRSQIAQNHTKSQREEAEGKLTFSSDINQLKNML